jgi:hypothetical protein
VRTCPTTPRHNAIAQFPVGRSQKAKTALGGEKTDLLLEVWPILLLYNGRRRKRWRRLLSRTN